MKPTDGCGTDPDFAQVLVQNRVASALASLPPSVQAQGVVTQKKSTAILQIVALDSPEGRYDSLYLSNYATINLVDELSRLPGVGNVNVFGAGQYSMRIWLDPNQLQARGLQPSDVIDAIKQQNQQVAAGQVGMPPAPSGQAFQYTVNVLGRLCRRAAVREHRGQGGAGAGRPDHARQGRRPGRARRPDLQPMVHLRRQAGGRHRHLPAARGQCPHRGRRGESGHGRGCRRASPRAWPTACPSTPRSSSKSRSARSTSTLFEAAVLVLIVILVFLQDWRATLVPATTVPVTIIGAFAAMAALGFTVNLLDPLRPGAGHRHRRRRRHRDRRERCPPHRAKGSTPKDAAIKAMSEVIGPIIGITLVLMAVFLPTAFLPGITGQLYRQFALVDRRHGDHQRHQRRDPEADPVRALPAAAERSQELLLSRLQSRAYDRRRAGLRRACRCRWCVDSNADGGPIAGVGGPRRLGVHPASHRLPADRGPGLRDRRRAASRRRIAGADGPHARRDRRRSSRDRRASTTRSRSAASRCWTTTRPWPTAASPTSS